MAWLIFKLVFWWRREVSARRTFGHKQTRQCTNASFRESVPVHCTVTALHRQSVCDKVSVGLTLCTYSAVIHQYRAGLYSRYAPFYTCGSLTVRVSTMYIVRYTNCRAEWMLLGHPPWCRMEKQHVYHNSGLLCENQSVLKRTKLRFFSVNFNGIEWNHL